jgi:hypothetical protein
MRFFAAAVGFDALTNEERTDDTDERVLVFGEEERLRDFLREPVTADLRRVREDEPPERFEPAGSGAPPGSRVGLGMSHRSYPIG